MASFIARQPNGRYCRFSTVVDTVTHYNMTEEDYLNNVTGTVANKAEGEYILKHYLRPFQLVLDSSTTLNMTVEEWDRIVEEMHGRDSSLTYQIT